MHTDRKKERTFRSPLYSRNRTEVPLELIRLEDNSYHLVARVEIDGTRGDMIIDTGASVSVLDRNSFPEKLQQEETSSVRIQTGSVTGQINGVGIVEVSTMAIGGRKLHRLELALIDLDYVNEMYSKHLKRKVIGLLGSDFCVRFGAVIDYRSRTLILNPCRR